MSRFLSVLSIFVVVSGLSFAQPGACVFGDDGFNSGCCQPVTPNLPTFPAITVAGKHGCVLNCNLEQEDGVSIQLGAPNFITCDLAAIDVTISPNTLTGPGYFGVIIAKYSRTWIEQTPISIAPRQVWRFMINSDLVAAAFTYGAPCPMPPSAYVGPAINLVHFWGSLDYACDFDPVIPGTSFSVRMDLNHLPGCVQHAPWSARPLSAPFYQLERSYHFVAPADFTFAPVPVPQGNLVGEATRESILSATGYQCFGESRVAQGDIASVSSECLCQPSIAGGWVNQTLNATAFCGATPVPIVSVPIPGTPMPNGLKTFGLGFYTPSASQPYPGQRDLSIYFGVLQTPTICAPNFPYHIVTGVATSGQPGELFGGVTPGVPMNTFIDFVNHKSATPTSTPSGSPPSFGALSYGDMVWNFNMP